MFFAQVTPYVIRVIDKPTRETSVYDVLINSVGLIGVIALGAVVFGLLLGGVLVTFRILRDRWAADEGTSDAATLNLSS